MLLLQLSSDQKMMQIYLLHLSLLNHGLKHLIGLRQTSQQSYSTARH